MQTTTAIRMTAPASPFSIFFQLPEWEPLFQRTTHIPATQERQTPAPPVQIAVEEENETHSLSTRNDFELIDLVLTGRTDAFGVLVTRYSASIYAVAFRMLRNHDDAADIAQDVFLKAYEALASFQKKSSFHTWLYRIATNSCINHLRKFTAQHHIELAAYHGVQEEETLDTLYKMELQDVVNEAIEKLPEKQKATVMLRVCDGLSHREVSRILKCSVGTAKANYFHAIRNLRRFMRNYIAANGMEDVIPPSFLRTGAMVH